MCSIFLAGVRRQIDDAIAQLRGVPKDLDVWWAGERTTDRMAINDMRNAELKRLQRGSERRLQAHTNASAGTFNGKRINAGDTVTWWDWRFTSGRFAGREVLSVLTAELSSLADLVGTAEMRINEVTG